MAGASVNVHGLRELTRAFQRMSKDLSQDMVWELQEAADPARKAATQLILGELRNMPATPYYAGMRIGVSKAQGLVYIAPDWRGRGGPRSRPALARLEKQRMERAVDQQAGEIEKGMEKFIDRLADEWGAGA